MVERHRLELTLLAVCAASALLWGWHTFWFLTDDAYIAFRYVSNSVLGHGWVWNPAPFLPVEGYSSPMWVVLLDGVWRLTGFAPPETANWLSLLCAALSLWTVAGLTWRVAWPSAWRRFRVGLVACVLAGCLSNRTFLAWTSSGLETALFNLLVLGWVGAMWRARRSEDGRVRARPWLVASMFAAALALTRPDGLLYLAVTLAAGTLAIGAHTRARRSREWFALFTPAGLVVVHVLWRRVTYGSWLPNTYYAKVSAAWPEAGALYLLSFLLEYAYWFWLGLLLVVLATPRGRDALRSLGHTGAVIAGTLLAHVSYYIVLVGGDHFEYRVLSHVVPLVSLAAVWLVSHLPWRPAAGLAVLGFGLFLSLPLPWTHFALTRDLVTRAQTQRLHVRLEPYFPPGTRAYVRVFDAAQGWLVRHYVGLRHQEHKINLAFVRTLFPARSEGRLVHGDFPVLPFPAVGYASWVLPHVNVIDAHGLSDAVVARSPGVSGQGRQMAHEHVAPPEYVACFEPDVFLQEGQALRRRRAQPMTAARIEACEAEWWRIVGLSPR